jgi:CarboxypepD_reg-like domain
LQQKINNHYCIFDKIYILMKSISLLIIGAVLFFSSTAQTHFVISGKISSDSSIALQAASVFAQNTTLGTVTDADGNFKLTLPNGGYDLIISFTGYKTETKRITTADANEKIEIKLSAKEKELEAVAIKSSNEVLDGLVKYGQFFKEEFIGKTPGSSLCNIQNPEVLHFFFSKKKNRLKITATEPLVIKNEVLGYNIKYELDSFTHEYKTELSTYSGNPLYENMQGDSVQMQKWNMARKEAYKGSLLHFMRSIFNKDLKEQQFEIQYLVKVYDKEEAIKVKDIYSSINYIKYDSTATVEIEPNQPEVGVLYVASKPSAAYLLDNAGEPKDFKFTTLSFKPKESIVIEQNGYFYDQNDVTISGYLAWCKIAEQLPYDFVFSQ